MDDSELQTTKDLSQIDTSQSKDGTFLRFIKSRKGNALGVLFTLVSLVLITLFVKHVQSQESLIVSDPSSFTQTDLGDGWIRYEKQDEQRFAISLPASWNVEIFNTDDSISELQELDLVRVFWTPC